MGFSHITFKPNGFVTFKNKNMRTEKGLKDLILGQFVEGIEQNEIVDNIIERLKNEGNLIIPDLPIYDLVAELLLYVQKDEHFVVNGFRTAEILKQLRTIIE